MTSPARPDIDLLLTNAKIATMAPAGTFAEALAAADGRIIAVGDEAAVAELAGPDTRVIDAGGRTVIPGLIDTHVHCDMQGTRIGRWLDFSWPGTRDKEAALAAIARAGEAKGTNDWVAGYRYDDVKLGGYPSRAELDKAGQGRPVFIFRTDGHVGLANSGALARCAIDETTPDPPFGRYDRDPETGRLTGLLRETAAHQVLEEAESGIKIEELADGLETVFQGFLALGITSIHNSLATRPAIKAYQRMREAGRLKMRVGIIASGREEGLIESLIDAGIRTGFGDDWIRLVGVEWCPDCSTSGRTAAYYEPYRGQAVLGEPADNRGMLLYETEDFARRVLAAHAAGLTVCADGVGDRGIDFVLDAYEAALEAHPRADHRMRVEHCCCVTPDIRARLKRLGVVASSASGFAYDLGEAYLRNRGAEAMKFMWPHRSLIDQGIPAPGHSDAPVCDPNPFRGIYSLVARKAQTGADLDASEAITLWEALEAYTTLGAWVGREEKVKGSLEPGKRADFAVLDRDIFRLPPDQLLETKTCMTVLDGALVHEAEGA